MCLLFIYPVLFFCCFFFLVQITVFLKDSPSGNYCAARLCRLGIYYYSYFASCTNYTSFALLLHLKIQGTSNARWHCLFFVDDSASFHSGELAMLFGDRQKGSIFIVLFMLLLWALDPLSVIPVVYLVLIKGRRYGLSSGYTTSYH
jgi:cobalamin synthase